MMQDKLDKIMKQNAEIMLKIKWVKLFLLYLIITI